jgi:hypothetical protein
MKAELLLCFASMATAVFPAAGYAPPTVIASTRAEHLSAEDLMLARASLRAILDEGADGEMDFWLNPRTRASGTVRAMESFERYGVTCRAMEVTFQGADKSEGGVWIFCPTSDGWELEPR